MDNLYSTLILARMRFREAKKDPARWPELCAALLDTWWGVWLLVPDWNTFGSSASFASMRNIGNENYWGIGCVVIGFAHLIGILGNSVRMRRLALIASCFLWALVTSQIVAANLPSTGVPVYGSLAIYFGGAYLLARGR